MSATSFNNISPSFPIPPSTSDQSDLSNLKFNLISLPTSPTNLIAHTVITTYGNQIYACLIEESHINNKYNFEWVICADTVNSSLLRTIQQQLVNNLVTILKNSTNFKVNVTKNHYFPPTLLSLIISKLMCAPIKQDITIEELKKEISPFSNK